MIIRITPNDKGHPPGKLADAELHFSEGPLDGLKLIGFSIWDRRVGSGRNVTFPARQYAVNGERRTFALLRPIVDSGAQGKLRELILEAFHEYEGQAAVAGESALDPCSRAWVSTTRRRAEAGRLQPSDGCAAYWITGRGARFLRALGGRVHSRGGFFEFCLEKARFMRRR